MSTPATSSPLAVEWDRLVGGLTAASERLRRELAECGRLTGSALARTDGAATAAPSGDDDDPSAFVRSRSAHGRAELVTPLRELDRRQPLRRVLAAFDAYRTGLGELVRRTPPGITVQAAELREVLGPSAGDAFHVRLAFRGDGERTVPLRAALEKALNQTERRQQAIEGRFAIELMQSIQDLRQNWRLTRDEIDRVAAGESPADPATVEAARKSPAGRVARAAESVLAELQGLSGELPGRVAGEAAFATLLGRTASPRSPRRTRVRHLEFWTAQLSSIEREMRFETDLFEAEQRILSKGLGACRSLERERESLLRTVDTLSTWLSGRLSTPDSDGPAPASPREVVPGLSRSNELGSEVRAIARTLPIELGVLRRLRETRTRRLAWRVLRPADLATEAFEGVCQAGMESLFASVEKEHLALFREIERAVQVVEYGTTDTGVDDPTDDVVEREALENARELLRTLSESVDPVLEGERRRMVALVAEFFDEYRTLLLRTRVGAVAHLGTMDVKNAVILGARGAWQRSLTALKWASRLFPFVYRQFLIAIQWIPEEEDATSEVTRRPYLPREFTVDVRSRDLPKIYGRLFRFEAVEDPRFLIGREVELGAIEEARVLWEDHRPVAVLVVGARGSGKTSLINCAIQRLEGLEIHRGEIHERVVDRQGLRAIISEIVGVADPARLEEELSERRSVVILEELERSFLREIHGFEAVRELQRLIAATGRSVLWIVACNQSAYALLNRAVALSDGFSHRIDAAGVSGEVLRQAILVRHNLSGLRLRFLPPPIRASVVERLEARVRRRRDPEEIFFEALAEESGGVFRTGFELWLGQVDNLRTGALDLRPLAEPEIDDLIGELDQEDLFALASTMQHGSLSPEEHARVFQQSVAASRAKLDELLARELIEPDPVRPGFRVRPAANRVVREALHRHNLD